MTYRNPRSTGSDSRVDASTTSVPGTTNPELRESFPMGQFQPSQKDQAIQVRGSKGQIPPVGILRIDYLAFCDRNNLWTVVFLHNLLLIARKARPFRDPFFVLYSFWLPFVLSLLKSGKEKQLSHTQRKGILTIYPYLYYLGGNRHTCHGGPSKEGMSRRWGSAGKWSTSLRSEFHLASTIHLFRYQVIDVNFISTLTLASWLLARLRST